MDESDGQEEGEITDDSDGNYNPLERPANYSAQVNKAPVDMQENESEDEVESSNDSDSDSGKKRPKLKPRRRAQSASKSYPQKYYVWSRCAQEDSLLENLRNCDVSKVDRSRSVETYPYPRHEWNERTDPKRNERSNNKRSFRDRSDNTLRLTKKECEEEEIEDIKGAPRILLDLNCTVEDSDQAIAKDVANKLFEEKEDLIERIVKVAGKQKTLSVYKEAKRIEAGGGMLIMNNTRRRTPGGVFLFLIKHDDDLTRNQLDDIFMEERSKSKNDGKLKKKQRAKEMKLRIANTRNQSDDIFGEEKSKSKIGGKRKKKHKAKAMKLETESLPELVTKSELVLKKVKDEPKCDDDGDQNLPKLLTTAELVLKKVKEEQLCIDEGEVLKKVKEEPTFDDEGQEAPPPSPVTDGPENSTDGMESVNGISDSNENEHTINGTKLNSYSQEYLDLGHGNDMDLN